MTQGAERARGIRGAGTQVRARLALALAAASMLLAIQCGECLAFGKLRTSGGGEAAWDLDGARLAVSGVNTALKAVRYVVDAQGSSSVPDSSEMTAVADSFDNWQGVATSRIAFERLPDAAAQVNSSDGQNSVVWNSGTVPPGVFALTMTTYYDTGQYAGVIVDSDIEMNDDIPWNTSTPGVLGQADVENIATHEIGHFIGLDHSPIGNASVNWSSWTGAIRNRTLEPDDEAGASSTYPEASFHSSFGGVAGKVSRGGQPVFGAWVLAIDASGRSPSVAAISNREGGYTIEGLPPGSYYLFAFRADASVMGSYYQAADTSFACRAYPCGLNPGKAKTATVFAGGQWAADFDVTNAVDPLEDDDGPAQATLIPYGSLAAASVESLTDEDWFRFDAQAGDLVTAGVTAYGAGSGLDPRIRLYDQTGLVLLAGNDDIIPPTPANVTGFPGPDLDARIQSFTVPSQGTHYLRITSSGSATSGHYLLYLFDESAGSLDAAVSDVWVNPSAITADGVSKATVSVLPKNGLGLPMGPGLNVAVELDGPGSVSAAVDLGNGVYAAEVTAPLRRGRTIAMARVGPAPGTYLDARPALEFLEDDEEGSCGCMNAGGGGPETVFGMIFPFLALSCIIALLRIACAKPGGSMR